AGESVPDDVCAERLEFVRRHAREKFGGGMDRQCVAPGRLLNVGSGFRSWDTRLAKRSVLALVQRLRANGGRRFSVRHRSPNLARGELPHDAARAEPELTDLATRHGSRYQQVIHLPDFFVALLFRQLVELAEKLGGDRGPPYSAAGYTRCGNQNQARRFGAVMRELPSNDSLTPSLAIAGGVPGHHSPVAVRAGDWRVRRTPERALCAH